MKKVKKDDSGDDTEAVIQVSLRLKKTKKSAVKLHMVYRSLL